MRIKHLERDVSVDRAAAGASYTHRRHAELTKSKYVLASKDQAARFRQRRRGRHDFPDQSANLAVSALKIRDVSPCTIIKKRSQEATTPLPIVTCDFLRMDDIDRDGPVQTDSGKLRVSCISSKSIGRIRVPLIPVFYHLCLQSTRNSL